MKELKGHAEIESKKNERETLESNGLTFTVLRSATLIFPLILWTSLTERSLFSHMVACLELSETNITQYTFSKMGKPITNIIGFPIPSPFSPR